MKIGELFVQLGFKGDNSKLKDFISGMGELNMSSVLATLGVGAVGTAFVTLAEKAAKAGQELRNYQLQTGQSAKDMQQWSMVAEQMGVDAGTAEASFRALQKAITQVKFGQGNIAPFQMLGVDPRNKPMKEVMADIHDAIKRLDPATASMILQMMGVDESMLNVLQASDELYASIEKQLYVTDQQIKSLAQLNRSYIEYGQTIRTIARMGIGTIAPFLDPSVMRKASPLFPSLFNPANILPGMGASAGMTLAASGGKSITFYIDGAVDPMKVAKQVMEEIKKVYSDTEYQSAAENR